MRLGKAFCGERRIMGNMHSTSLGVLSWFAVFFLPFTLLFASPQMDEDYSLRRVAIGVMGLSQETVHGEAVAGAIAAWMAAMTNNNAQTNLMRYSLDATKTLPDPWAAEEL